MASLMGSSSLMGFFQYNLIKHGTGGVNVIGTLARTTLITQFSHFSQCSL